MIENPTLATDVVLFANEFGILQLEAIGLEQDPLFYLAMLIAAFAGGVLGAALGALPAFVFMGFVIIGGEALRMATVHIEGVAVPFMTFDVAFGAFFGPHITFAAGAAASAYAAKKGYMEEGFGGGWGYHDGKNILIAFGGKFNDVLIVGGLFGIFGYLVWLVSDPMLSLPWDGIALGVVLSALVHRLAFGYDVIGDIKADGILDLSPFDDEETHETDGTQGKPADRLNVEPWLPWFRDWTAVSIVGLSFGVLGGITFYWTGSMFLAFGISAATLIFLNTGITEDFAIFQVPVPVTHHITLPVATAPAAYAGLGVAPEITTVHAELLLIEAVVFGAVFGLLGGLLGELAERIFYAHGDTHWDPPATSIVLTSLLIGVLYLVGVFASPGYVPVP